MIYIEASDSVPPSFTFPWMSSLPFFVVYTCMQKIIVLSLISHPWAVFIFLIISNIFTSDFDKEEYQTAQLATVHPAVNVKNIQINPISLIICSDCHTHVFACFFHLWKCLPKVEYEMEYEAACSKIWHYSTSNIFSPRLDWNVFHLCSMLLLLLLIFCTLSIHKKFKSLRPLMLNVSHPVLISLHPHTLWSERKPYEYVLMTGFKWAGTTWSVSKTSEWELKDLQEAQVPKSLFLGLCTWKSSLSSLLSLQLLTSAAPLKCFSPSKCHQDLPSQNSTPLKLFLLHYHDVPFVILLRYTSLPQFASITMWI